MKGYNYNAVCNTENVYWGSGCVISQFLIVNDWNVWSDFEERCNCSEQYYATVHMLLVAVLVLLSQQDEHSHVVSHDRV